VDKLDFSVALAGAFTALVRGSMPTAPMFLIRAHVRGTGKSYLIDLFSTLATGDVAPVIGVPKSEEEFEKRLGALLMAGVPVIALDNIVDDLGGPSLCQVTERPRVRFRVLGKSEHTEWRTIQTYEDVHDLREHALVIGHTWRGHTPLAAAKVPSINN
jgi:putative DNA primase/helicase